MKIIIMTFDSLYIRVCECLLADIYDAEFYPFFLSIHAQMIKWDCALTYSEDSFEKKQT